MLANPLDRVLSCIRCPPSPPQWGYTTALPPCTYGNRVSEATQAKYLARIWLTSTLVGSPATILYDWHSDGTDATNCEDNFGTVRATYRNASAPFDPKPAYHAAVAAQGGVGDGVFVGRVAAAAIAPPPGGAANATDVFVLRFAMPSGAPAFAAWTNLSVCGAINGSARGDCGFNGISHEQCTARSCCWDGAAAPAGPQCYFGLPPGAPLAVSFEASPSAPAACFTRVLDVLGGALPPVCAVDGVLTVNVTDGPVYVLP